MTNLSKEEAFKLVTNKLKSLSSGGYLTSFKLNDWCISRQRKWGAPIPIVYCHNCQVFNWPWVLVWILLLVKNVFKIVPVPVEQLPVELDTNCFRNEHKIEFLHKTKCPK